jgi:transcriptional regulator of arginine metabolism
MSPADLRRDLVARLLRTRRIGTQEELLAALAEAGFQATQATLSRDLARLGARRVSRPEGGTRYELPDAAPGPDALGALRGLVTHVAANASMVVIRTHPGSAPAIARAIDLAQVPEVLGTIAGDDTIFVAPAGDLRPRRLADRLADLLGVPAGRADGAEGKGQPAMRAHSATERRTQSSIASPAK